MAVRLPDYDRVASRLAACDDTTLRAWLRAAPVLAVGVGGTCVLLDVDGVPVFAKRIPLSDWELAHPRSTMNLFDLPLWCHYDAGGAGLSAWRELAANLTVTAGVLTGDTRGFAPLYHWRVLPGRPQVEEVAAAGDSAEVRLRRSARAAASWSLVLFHEYVPLPLAGRLASEPDIVERELFEIVAFLRDRELLHMDGHLDNLRTDGQRSVLVDFGLATSPHFDLSPEERDFVRRHATHDAEYAAMTIVNGLVTSACGVDAKGPTAIRDAYVARCATGDIPTDVPAHVGAILARHAATAARLNGFYARVRAGELPG